MSRLQANFSRSDVLIDIFMSKRANNAGLTALVS